MTTSAFTQTNNVPFVVGAYFGMRQEDLRSFILFLDDNVSELVAMDPGFKKLADAAHANQLSQFLLEPLTLKHFRIDNILNEDGAFYEVVMSKEVTDAYYQLNEAALTVAKLLLPLVVTIKNMIKLSGLRSKIEAFGEKLLETKD